MTRRPRLLSFTLTCAVLVLAATVSHADETKKFRVIFDGIIIHDLCEDDPMKPAKEDPCEGHRPRAIVVQGNAFSMRHAAVLAAPLDIDVAALHNATGHIVRCDAYACRASIDGLDIRIGGEDSSEPSGLTVDRRFHLLTPHLYRVTGGIARRMTTSDLPEPPAGAYFELAGGTLSACAFPRRAFFKEDYDHEGLRWFADKVFFTGELGAKAAIHIRSSDTGGKWKIVKRTGSKNERLKICIENHATNRKTSHRHFALNEKLLDTKEEFPAVCPDVRGNDAEVDPRCPANSAGVQPRADALPAEYFCGDDEDDSCPMKPVPVPEGSPSFEMVAGCANTQWP